MRRIKGFEYLVIGGGSGGLASARRAATYGKKVGLIESKKLGGTCVNEGCVPKKMLFGASSIWDSMKLAPSYGITMENKAYNWGILKEKRTQHISKLNEMFKGHLESSKIEYISGKAQFVEDKVIECGGELYTADHILIATGSKPMIFPPSSGIENELLKSSDDFFQLDELPEKAFIVGGGYIGVELAGIMASFGVKCQVCMLEETVVPGFDEEVCRLLMDAMRSKGIAFYPQQRVIKVLREADMFALTLQNLCTKVDYVLSAIGRAPNIEDLGLQETGIKVEGGGIISNEYEESSVEGVYAIGDVTGKAMLTPVAIAAGRHLSDRLFGGKSRAKLDYELIPSVVFSHPPMGKVGLTEQQAVHKYGKEEIMVYKSQFNNLLYAPVEEALKEKTFLKLVVHKSSDIVLGLHGLGLGIDEMIQGFAVAIKMGATKAQFDATVAIHPTSSEEFVTMK